VAESREKGREIYVVKFGGSAITDKARPYTFLRGRIAPAASALRGRRAILIHGAGSYAHPHVSAFGLTPLGTALIKASLKRLTARVIEELAEAGVYAVPIEPSDVFWGRALIRREVIAHALERGMYPLLHGDVVPSDEGYVVLSGDDIAAELARAFSPRAVIFLMGADGIYTAPPGAPGAAKIKRLAREAGIAGASGIDVTGGVRKKVEVGMAIAAAGIPVYFCSALDIESIKSILRGSGTHNCTYAGPEAG
jgi:isopentenyl phosphate kinase